LGGVVQDEDGDAMAQCGVWLERARLDGKNGGWDVLEQSWTRFDGSYAFSCLAADNRAYRITVDPVCGIGVSPDIRPSAHSERVNVPAIRAQRPSRVEGRIVRGDGKPMAGVIVRIETAGPEHRSVAIPERVGVTDLGGEFCVSGLVSGQYTMKFVDLGLPLAESQDQELRVGDGETKRMTVEWSGGRWIVK